MVCCHPISFFIQEIAAASMGQLAYFWKRVPAYLIFSSSLTKATKYFRQGKIDFSLLPFGLFAERNWSGSTASLSSSCTVQPRLGPVPLSFLAGFLVRACFLTPCVGWPISVHYQILYPCPPSGFYNEMVVHLQKTSTDGPIMAGTVTHYEGDFTRPTILLSPIFVF